MKTLHLDILVCDITVQFFLNSFISKYILPAGSYSKEIILIINRKIELKLFFAFF